MIHPNSNKVIIFDLGNVVLEWNIDRILESLKLGIDELDLLRTELFYHQNWVDLDHGKTSETAVAAQICERSSLTSDAVEMALLTAKNSLSPITESILLMREIMDSGIEMFCLSNMSRETYDHIKDEDFFGMFSGIVISGIEGCMKPNEDIFHLTIGRFGLKPADTIFIDDSLPNVETAQRLGINGFHFKRSQRCYSEIRKLLL